MSVVFEQVFGQVWNTFFFANVWRAILIQNLPVFLKFYTPVIEIFYAIGQPHYLHVINSAGWTSSMAQPSNVQQRVQGSIVSIQTWGAKSHQRSTSNCVCPGKCTQKYSKNLASRDFHTSPHSPSNPDKN